ncbi:hypothetical protein PB2503_02107 [Parvularcula bermudensis HTCC2503]|uniref:DUF721 domain-containing protein n=1 Tax=Parvularcula bermudensis (strain ATCC BAA-594 / HTCC2503 / KCTC 12087) TaxID=314260 RepID=E0TC67_PARBH|nr:DUF721 domain-containing protein [Parvularcula bermudensis]ADM08500.1 hypothetical protein PB2503_02107 [Parvularcula bermudensis HTCC2503]
MPFPPPPVKTKGVRPSAPTLRRQTGDLLADLAKKAGIIDPAIVTYWADIVGPDLEALCRPVRLKKNRGAFVLHVDVPHGGAATQVHYAQGNILAKASRHVGRPITRLVIEQTGRRAEPTRWRSRRMTDPQVDRPPFSVGSAATTEEALAALRKALSETDSP